ncbi:Peroxisome biogenesis factor 10 [Frankliniella fusca]|uniref:Peroxisome biogenesis factor 10 n=1 Tax=Frankliniella fusca TaxID=407009 RepID=A0AAE1H8R5_9NEOP|nr:Peroxisome biogenesis factor 10 [Frankliniella fusca]KAK3913728.1 Peroxisome biogenesis factor 10 [Frankliniella fusca]KAK3914707.1 Peroxisome biogenesis factor 10 [Frankliniella fusca]KAK3916917.1 Peroxisome biogenesis factor 10 [Frankliniella fusca]KAK3920403.1 Peroxisome biogenesis factor 10 [Frankliniella fusca]
MPRKPKNYRNDLGTSPKYQQHQRQHPSHFPPYEQHQRQHSSYGDRLPSHSAVPSLMPRNTQQLHLSFPNNGSHARGSGHTGPRQLSAVSSPMNISRQHAVPSQHMGSNPPPRHQPEYVALDYSGYRSTSSHLRHVQQEHSTATFDNNTAVNLVIQGNSAPFRQEADRGTAVTPDPFSAHRLSPSPYNLSQRYEHTISTSDSSNPLNLVRHENCGFSGHVGNSVDTVIEDAASPFQRYSLPPYDSSQKVDLRPFAFHGNSGTLVMQENSASSRNVGNSRVETVVRPAQLPGHRYSLSSYDSSQTLGRSFGAHGRSDAAVTLEGSDASRYLPSTIVETIVRPGSLPSQRYSLPPHDSSLVADHSVATGNIGSVTYGNRQTGLQLSFTPSPRMIQRRSAPLSQTERLSASTGNSYPLVMQENSASSRQVCNSRAETVVTPALLPAHRYSLSPYDSSQILDHSVATGNIGSVTYGNRQTGLQLSFTPSPSMIQRRSAPLSQTERLSASTGNSYPLVMQENSASSRQVCNSRAETVVTPALLPAHRYSLSPYDSSQILVNSLGAYGQSDAVIEQEGSGASIRETDTRVKTDVRPGSLPTHRYSLSPHDSSLVAEHAIATGYVGNSTSDGRQAGLRLLVSPPLSAIQQGSYAVSQIEGISVCDSLDNIESEVVESEVVESEVVETEVMETEGVHSELSDATAEDDGPVTLMRGSSSNCGAIYRPGVNKPDDVDEPQVQVQQPSNAGGKRRASTSVSAAKPSTKAPPAKTKPPTNKAKETKAKSDVKTKPKSQGARVKVAATRGKKASNKAALEKLRQEAEQFYANEDNMEEETTVERREVDRQSSRRRVVNEGEPYTLDSDDDDADVGLRCSRRLAEAYKRARSQEDADDEVACLKRAGVLLPNGFKQMKPFFSEEGEMLLSLFNEDHTASEGHQDNTEELLEKEKSSDGRPQCPICLDLVKQPYQCEECQQLFCWVCFDEWLKHSGTCPLCRNKKDVILVPVHNGDRD